MFIGWYLQYYKHLSCVRGYWPLSVFEVFLFLLIDATCQHAQTSHLSFMGNLRAGNVSVNFCCQQVSILFNKLIKMQEEKVCESNFRVNIFISSVTNIYYVFIILIYSDTPAVSESFAAAGHRVSEQCQPKCWTKPTHCNGDGADRHRYHHWAGRAEGTAGSH